MSQTSTAATSATAQSPAERWHSSVLHARVSAGFGGIPTLLAQTLPEDHGVLADPAHWHCVLYGDLVLRKVGTTFTAADCYAALRRHDLTWHDTTAAQAVCAFLAHLRAAGHLAYDAGPHGRPTGDVRVVGDLFTLASPASSAPTPVPAPVAPTPVPAPSPQVRAPQTRGGDTDRTGRPDGTTSATVQPQPQTQTPAAAPTGRAARPEFTRARDSTSTPNGTVMSTPSLPSTASVVAPAQRTARTAAEASWVHATTRVLAAHGVHGAAAEALIAMSRWGTPVLEEPLPV